MIRTELGRRIELVAMDPHFHDITVALHRAVGADGGPAYHINSYSTRPGAHERLAGIVAAMQEVGGMDAAPESPLRVRFACGAAHEQATRRAFIEACKLDPGQPLEARPMELYDKKTDATIRVIAEGGDLLPRHGRLRTAPRWCDGSPPWREVWRSWPAWNRFPLPSTRCASPAATIIICLVAMLLKLALNARGVLREQELAAARGVLAAPSQQR